MMAARTGRFRFLVVWRLDRFGRQMQGNLNDVLELDRVGVEVVSVREPWLGAGGPARNLLLAIFSWLAEEERRVLVERVRAGMARARKEGRRCGGSAPVPAEKIAAAAARVLEGVPLKTAAREQAIGSIPVRKFLAAAATESVRAGAAVRAVSKQYHLGVNTIRRVLGGRSYLNRYPVRGRCPEGTDVRHTYLPFERARELARGLGLHRKADWISWSRSDAYTLEMPLRPNEFYREWKGWSDWLNFTKRLPFSEARAYARELGLHSRLEWRDWCRGSERPNNVPADPRMAYPEFDGWADWLGYRRTNFRGEMMPFPEAREYARRLSLHSAKEWFHWARSPSRPRNIAGNPDKTYAALWKGWRDWLGYPLKIRLPFREARRRVRRLGLGSEREWKRWAGSAERPQNIPRKPRQVYAAEWQGMANWLGYNPRKMSFLEARRAARRLGLRSSTEWWAWSSCGKRPKNMPSDPRGAYPFYWRSWGDWLGVSVKQGRPPGTVSQRAFLRRRRRVAGRASNTGPKPAQDQRRPASPAPSARGRIPS